MFLDEQLDAATDVPCVQCGYSLRGLAPTGRCPECGTALTESFRGNLLRFANIDWLTGVRRGVRLLFWANVAWLVLGWPMSVLATGGRGSVATWYVLSVALSASYILGVVLFTRQEPRLSLTEAAWSWRRMTRRAAMLAVLVGLARTATGYLDSEISDWAAYILADCTTAAVLFTVFAYVHELAVRIPDRRIARSSAILKWALPVLLLLYEGARIVGDVLGSPPAAAGTGSRMTAAEIVTLCAFGVFAVFWIWSCIVLGRCHRALRTAMTSARSLHRSAEGVPIARPIVGIVKG